MSSDVEQNLRQVFATTARRRVKSILTYALTLMNKIGRWNDEKWIGPKFVACVRICSKQYEPTKVLMDRFWTWILYKEQLVNVKLE